LSINGPFLFVVITESLFKLAHNILICRFIQPSILGKNDFMAEKGYNSLDVSAEDYDICIGNDGGESGDTVRRSQVFKYPIFKRYFLSQT